VFPVILKKACVYTEFSFLDTRKLNRFRELPPLALWPDPIPPLGPFQQRWRALFYLKKLLVIY
jgi:hypothetical protein